MAQDVDDQEEDYPALVTVEEFASRAILTSISVIFMSLFLLMLLELQVLSIILPAQIFGLFVTLIIILAIGYLTPKLYMYGAMIFGSYWDMARREDLNVNHHSNRKTTGFFIGFTLFGMLAIYLTNLIWLQSVGAPDQRLLSIMMGNPGPLVSIQVFLLELASAGSIVLFAAPVTRCSIELAYAIFRSITARNAPRKSKPITECVPIATVRLGSP